MYPGDNRMSRDITEVHEGSHKDNLYRDMGGKGTPIPLSKFARNPISAEPRPVLQEIFSRNKEDNLYTDNQSMDRAFEKSLKNVSKDWKLSGGDSKEVLAEIKSLEASLPRGGDIRQTLLWHELVKKTHKNINEQSSSFTRDLPIDKVQSMLTQWYLYNNSAPSIPNLQRILRSPSEMNYAPEVK